ncbi:hypothetical protein HanRHA438_Chr13g0589491 [Helianthus annuus]|nr:hypothetical protein HanRHA438_Chr13g0589491 [Helianthus annuus]
MAIIHKLPTLVFLVLLGLGISAATRALFTLEEIYTHGGYEGSLAGGGGGGGGGGSGGGGGEGGYGGAGSGSGAGEGGGHDGYIP